MEKAKKITSDQLLAKNNMPTHRTIIWHGMAITVRTLLPIQEVSQFVNSVMDCCYDKSRDIFVPDMKDFAFRFNVVSRYACVDLPTNIEEQYSVLYNTDIYDSVLRSVNSGQIAALNEAINICMRNL